MSIFQFNSKIKKVILYVIILLVAGINIILTVILLTGAKVSFLPSELSENNYGVKYTLLDSKNDEYKKQYKLKNVIAWIASFDYQNGKNQFYKNISKFTEISPVNYDVNIDGTMSVRSVARDADLVNIAHKNGVKITPTIICFDENALQAMLNDENKFSAHQDFIMKEIKDNNYDGIDIDYESINLTDKELYLKMIQDLSGKLHALGKTLSVSLIAKDKDSGYSSLIETRQVQDINFIGRYADEMRIMAYDYSPDTTPGPVSPINWVNNVINYNIDKTIKEKIILGQPMYGYAYGAKRYAYTFDEIDEIIKSQNLTSTFDETNNEKNLVFKKGNEERKMWYQDGETMLKRFNLIDTAEIGGVSFWRLGGEDQGIYSYLAKR